MPREAGESIFKAAWNFIPVKEWFPGALLNLAPKQTKEAKNTKWE